MGLDVLGTDAEVNGDGMLIDFDFDCRERRGVRRSE